MEKNIILQDVSYAANIGRANRKIIKKLSLNIKDGSNFSFVANEIEKSALINILSNKTSDIWGKIDYNGNYFKQFERIQDGFFILNKKDNRINKFQNNNNNILSFLKIDHKHKKNIKVDLLNKINFKKKEINKLYSKQKHVISKKGFLNNEYIKKIEVYNKFKIEQNKLIKDQLEYLTLKNSFLSENKRISKFKKDLMKFYKKNKNFIIKKHNKKINWQRLSTSNELDKISLLLEAEKKSIAKKEQKFKTKKINDDKEFKFFKKELVSLHKYIDTIVSEKIKLTKKYIKNKELLVNSVFVHDLFMSFIELLKFIEKNTSNLKNIEKKEIKNKLKNLFKIKNNIDELIVSDFVYFKKIIKREFISKSEYYNHVMADINKRLLVVDIEDKKEKYHFMRKAWEFERISLRYQLQLYKEKNEIIKKYDIEISDLSYKIPYIHNDKVYLKYLEYLELLLLIDVAITKWRKQRGVKSEKVYLNQKLKTQNNFLQNNKKEISELNKLIIDPIIFDAVDNSYVEFFKNKYYNIIKEKLLNDLDENESNKQEEMILKLNQKINVSNSELELLEDKLKNIEYNMRNYAKDLITSTMGQNININTPLSELSYFQQNRLLILKEIIKGKKIIIIDDLEIISGDDDIGDFLNILKTDYNITFIVFSKNIDLAIEASDYIAICYKGIVVEFGNTINFLNNKHHEFTLKLINDSQNKYILNEQSDFDIQLGNRFSGTRLKKINTEHWVFENTTL